MQPWVIGAGAAGLLLLLSSSKARAPGTSGKYSYGGAPVKAGIDRDPRNLEPAFAQKVELIFQRLRARGFDPLLWEGYRTAARARKLEAEGVGTHPSLHQYGMAADIVDRTLRWNAPRAFWDAVGEETDRVGLTWGGHWNRRDLPHVQWVTIAEQPAIYARPAPAPRVA